MFRLSQVLTVDEALKCEHSAYRLPASGAGLDAMGTPRT